MGFTVYLKDIDLDKGFCDAFSKVLIDFEAKTTSFRSKIFGKGNYSRSVVSYFLKCSSSFLRVCFPCRGRCLLCSGSSFRIKSCNRLGRFWLFSFNLKNGPVAEEPSV